MSSRLVVFLPACLLVAAATGRADVDIPADLPPPDGHVIVAEFKGWRTVRRPRAREIIAADSPIPEGYVVVRAIESWALGRGRAVEIKRPADPEWILGDSPIPRDYVIVERKGRGKEARVRILTPAREEVVTADSPIPEPYVAVRRIVFEPRLQGAGYVIRKPGSIEDVVAESPVPLRYVVVALAPAFRHGYKRIERPGRVERIVRGTPIPPRYVISGMVDFEYLEIRLPREEDEVFAGSPVPEGYVVVRGPDKAHPGRMRIRRATGGVEDVVYGSPIPKGYVAEGSVSARGVSARGVSAGGAKRTGPERIRIRPPHDGMLAMEVSPLPAGWVIVGRKTAGGERFKRIRRPGRREVVAYDSPIPKTHEAVAYHAAHKAFEGPALEIRRLPGAAPAPR